MDGRDKKRVQFQAIKLRSTFLILTKFLEIFIRLFKILREWVAHLKRNLKKETYNIEKNYATTVKLSWAYSKCLAYVAYIFKYEEIIRNPWPIVSVE